MKLGGSKQTPSGSPLTRSQDHPWDTISGLTHTFYCRHFGRICPLYTTPAIHQSTGSLSWSGGRYLEWVRAEQFESNEDQSRRWCPEPPGVGDSTGIWVEGFDQLNEPLTLFKAQTCKFPTISKRNSRNLLPFSRLDNALPYSKQ